MRSSTIAGVVYPQEKGRHNKKADQGEHLFALRPASAETDQSQEKRAHSAILAPVFEKVKPRSPMPADLLLAEGLCAVTGLWPGPNGNQRRKQG